jgi:hypothetical protein
LTVDFAYSITQFICNKNQNGGNISPDEFNAVITQAQLGLFNYLLGQFQDYSVGRPGARVEFGVNMVVRQRLAPFIGPRVLLTVDDTGFVSYPADYQQWDAFFQINLIHRLRPVQQNKLYSFIKSFIDPIATNPVVTIEDKGFRVYPNPTDTGTSIPNSQFQLSYVSTPPAIVWRYTPDSITGLPVYNPSTSVDPKWYDVDMMEVISRALAMIGINLQSQEVSQYAGMITKGGQ